MNRHDPRREIEFICWLGLAAFTLYVLLWWAGMCGP